MAEVSVVVSRDDGPDVAYGILRAEVARLLGSAAGEVVVAHRCPHCGSADHGRPLVVLPDGRRPPHVSIGRTRGLTVVAVSEAGSVGVDVEPVGAASFDGFDDVALHPAERAATAGERTRSWVRKEALLKATGAGLRTDPREVRVDADFVLLADGTTAWLRDVDAGTGDWVVAVAVVCAEPPRLSVRAAPAATGGGASR